MGKQWKQWETLFWGGFKITADGGCSHEIKRRFLLGRKAMINLDSILKSRDVTVQQRSSYSFSSSHVWLWELDHKEIWVLKNGCFWTVVLEKSLESPSYCKEIKPIIPNGNQSRILIGRTDAEASILMLGKIEGRWRGDDRGWDGRMASPTQWTWVWVNAGS